MSQKTVQYKNEFFYLAMVVYYDGASQPVRIVQYKSDTGTFKTVIKKLHNSGSWLSVNSEVRWRPNEIKIYPGSYETVEEVIKNNFEEFL